MAFAIVIALLSPRSSNTTIIQSLSIPDFRLYMWLWKAIFWSWKLCNFFSFCYRNVIFGMDSARKTSPFLSESVPTDLILIFQAKKYWFPNYMQNTTQGLQDKYGKLWPTCSPGHKTGRWLSYSATTSQLHLVIFSVNFLPLPLPSKIYDKHNLNTFTDLYEWLN